MGWGGERVLELRMEESKDVEMKGLLQALLLQKLLNRVPLWPLNVFALERALRLSPRLQPCASCASFDRWGPRRPDHTMPLCVCRQNVIRPMGVRPDGTLAPLEETLRDPEDGSGSDSD